MSTDDDLTDDELLNLPEIPQDRLAEYFSRRAGIVQQRQLGERIAELSGNSLNHFLLSPDRDPREKHRREEAERHWRTEQEMLLIRIEEEQIRVRKRMEDIDARTIRLHDGRRAYVDGNGYVDREGRALTGTDDAEARREHALHPNAATAQEKADAERQSNELDKLRRDVGEGSADNGYESRLKEAAESREVDASAYDYAGPAGGEGKTATAAFASASYGNDPHGTIVETAQKERAPQPLGQGAKLNI